MKKQFGVIFLLIGFLVFSFSGTVCLISKLKSQEVIELIGGVAEEEDESGKEDGSDSEVLMAMFEHVSSHYLSLEYYTFSLHSDQLPTYNPNMVTPPPRG